MLAAVPAGARRRDVFIVQALRDAPETLPRRAQSKMHPTTAASAALTRRSTCDRGIKTARMASEVVLTIPTATLTIPAMSSEVLQREFWSGHTVALGNGWT